MKSVNVILVTLFLLVLGAVFLNESFIKHKEINLGQSEKIYLYLKQESNQKKVFDKAISLNDKSSSNACVYFVSEVLRENKVPVPTETANTSQLISLLKNRGWKVDSDYKNLMPGDIVFTTDEAGNKKGIPSHTYVFMNWVKEGSYDYAYICDNQAKDYKNKIYHIRNIKDRDTVKGITKDSFSFFMKPV